jgi:5'-nucleotidase/UDP-sugar diphosphatase
MKSIVPVLLALLLIGCEETQPDYDFWVLHTNDSHSHRLGLPNCEYQGQAGDGTVGGAARLATLIDRERAAHEELLLFSAGDFTMGTMLVDAEDQASDLNILKELEYDAAALGNHEFDWEPHMLAEMINNADQPPVPLLAANIHFSDKTEDDALEALYGMPGEAGKLVYPYIVLETPGGTKAGVFGIMGLDAEEVSNASPVYFSGDMDTLAQETQEVVDTLRKQKKVDVVLCLAHVGIKEEEGSWVGETVELAERVEGIDVILSGHQHTVVPEAFEVQHENGSWKTVTMEAGCYGQHLGRYHLVREGGRKTISGELIGIDDSVESKTDIQQHVDEMVTDVETNFLSRYPQVPEAGAFLTGDYYQVLAHSDFDIPRHGNQPNNLGYLAADAMREDSGAQITAVSNGGDLRRSLNRVNGDEFCLADVFISTPLGIGPDGIPGYPQVKFHLSLVGLKLVLEATVCDMGLTNNDYMLSLSGLRIIYDSSGDVYNRVQKLILYENIDESDAGTVIFDKENGGFQVPQDDLISICTTSYIASFLTSFNLTPKYADGSKIEDLDDAIVKDAGGREIKLWYSLARKLASFPQRVFHQYNDDEALNPVGPYWRRSRDLDIHPLP